MPKYYIGEHFYNTNYYLIIKNLARHQWLIPIFLAIQETEIEASPGKIVHETLFQKNLVEWLKV
jgi:hypothetical protein